MKGSPLPKILAIAAVAAALLLSGFGSIYSNYREIENLQVVQTLGLDAENGRLTLTASTGQGADGKEGVIISRPADSVIEGFEAVHHYSSREAVYLSHTRFVLLGEKASKERFSELSDFLRRSSALRLDMTLFALTQGDAKTLIADGGTGDYEITNTLSSIETDVLDLGVGYDTTCREVLRGVNEYGAALICAVRSAKTEDAVFSESGDAVPIPAGFVIVKDNAACGTLDEKSAWGANLLLGRSGFGSVTLSAGGENEAVLILNSGKTEYSADWSPIGTLISLDATISLTAVLGELTEGGEADTETIDALEAELSEYTVRQCRAVLEKSKNLEADFLGLYGILRGQYPAEAAPFKGRFGELTEKMEINVSAECTIEARQDEEE